MNDIAQLVETLTPFRTIPTDAEVYYNLHKQCLSYREPGGHVKHADMLALIDVRFTVQPAGQARVRKEGRKNVHAYLRGIVTHVGARGAKLPLTGKQLHHVGAERITYDPYRYDTFVFADTGVPVKKAARVIALEDRSVWALPKEEA